MPGAFQGITTLSSALDTFQTQINVTGENIANVDTAGYVEQTANLVEAPSSTSTQGATSQTGDGVSVQSITNIQTAYLDQASNTAAADLGKANAQAQTTTSVNAIVADPNSTGIASQIDAFYNSWSSLASSPTSSNQLGVQQAASTLSQSLNQTYSALNNVKQSASSQIATLLQQAQGYVNQIAQLNSSISANTINGSTPNDLIDQRNEAVSNLSSLMNVSVTKSADGTVSVSSGNLILVNQSGARTIPTTVNAQTGSLTSSNGSYAISSGQISGLMDSVNKVDSYESSLTTLASQISTSVNSAYSTAKNSSGTTGGTFFTGSLSEGTFGVSSSIASDPTTIAVGTSGEESDTGVAQQIANLGTTTLSGLGNQTSSSYYGQLLGQIGTDGQTATNSQTTQQAVSAQVSAQVQSISGVDLDTEMSNLLRYQSSYQAAAQALSAMDQTVQTLLTTINM